MAPKPSQLLQAEAELEHLESLIDINSEAGIADVPQIPSCHKSGHDDRRRKAILPILGVGVFGLLVILLLHLKRPNHPDDLLVLKDPAIIRLTPQFFPEHKSERVQIKYGPFTIPGNGHDNGMKSIKMRDAKMPCRNCSIFWIQAGLEFWDGRYASPKEGMWLHHTVLRNEGREGPKSCKMGGTERFFASGSERTVIDLGSNGTEKIGYWLDEKDTVSIATELMNSHEESQTAVFTITYEYIPYQAHDFVNTRPIWMDVGGCHSDVAVPKDQTSFEVESPVWLSRINGQVVKVLSHLHDGGVHLRLQKNREVVCESKAEYRMTTDSEIHSQGMDMSHITVMPACSNVGRMDVGEEWSVKVQYDLKQHQPMLNHKGKAAPVMGIAIVYIIED